MAKRIALEVSFDVPLIAALTLLTAASGCSGGSSDSEVPNVAGSTSGASAQSGGAASAGNANSASTGGSAAGSAGSNKGGAAGSAGDDACEVRQRWTEAIHYELEVTWPTNIATVAGSGRVHLWSRADVTASGNELQLALHVCGAILPEASLSAAGKLATGGGEKLLIEVPDSIWDAPGIPVVMAKGTHAGFTVGSDIGHSSLLLLGATLSDPMGSWPESGAETQAVDVEADGALGYTTAPRNSGGYVLPPVAIGLGSGPAAEKVYLVSRHGMNPIGKWTSCDAHSGMIDVSAFDTHVVGCRVEGGSECSAAQAAFVDDNRMLYTVASATYAAKVIPEGSSCADVRAVLPPQ
jgi:hypothetical protein